jgi:hypothetical protein
VCARARRGSAEPRESSRERFNNALDALTVHVVRSELPANRGPDEWSHVSEEHEPQDLKGVAEQSVGPRTWR